MVEHISATDPSFCRISLDHVRILAPFDPIVRDSARFEHIWGWEYRFETYTPKIKRKLSYYAMSILWRDEVVGWANASVAENRLSCGFGYVNGLLKDS